MNLGLMQEKESNMKMYGFAWVMGWTCICYGKKSWFFKLYYGKAIKRFKWASWTTDTKNVWWQRVNSYPFRFFGLFILPNDELYDLELL